MKRYYQEKLSADRLSQCYRLAPPRVKQYFTTEIAHVLKQIAPHDRVLELGCGYGRVLPQLAGQAERVVGLDNSCASLTLAREETRDVSNCHLVEANAIDTGFKDNSFQVVICIQNGISAFHVDQSELIKESVRVTQPGGRVLFSSYSEKFWHHRLEWFRMQADAGLLGEIDWGKTRSGVIVCKDGFKATTVGPGRFLTLTARLGLKASLQEVDESSLFCEITVYPK
ncbi:MAG: class I SAM-dependent methyltransferase [bacterium]|nr:class I SAM-dependent methyltransferase [bacterium]